MKMSNSPPRNHSLERDEDSSTPVQTHALQLALKTMNERCQQLQQRLTIVEDENVKLRVKIDSDKTLRLDCSIRPSEYEQLREKVEELNRQKNQLSHHINMVATENRHLWSRLSKMTKDNHSIESARLTDSIEQQSPTPTRGPQHHIIRSKTFTQSTPNSKLCPKIDSESDLSLEEISLKLINNFIQDKSVLEEQYEQMVEMHSNIDCDEVPCINLGNIGFSYMTDGNEDSGLSLTQCVEGYDMIRKQILKQKNDLNKILSNLQKRNDETICSKCRTIIDMTKTPENNKRFRDFNNETKWATPVSSTSQLLDKSIQIETDNNAIKPINCNNLFRPISDINLETQDLGKSNDSDESYDTMISRICPMCTKIFPNMSLHELTDHVEQHFIGENDNMVMENNYELVTHSVGNF